MPDDETAQRLPTGPFQSHYDPRPPTEYETAQRLAVMRQQWKRHEGIPSVAFDGSPLHGQTDADMAWALNVIDATEALATAVKEHIDPLMPADCHGGPRRLSPGDQPGTVSGCHHPLTMTSRSTDETPGA